MRTPFYLTLSLLHLPSSILFRPHNEHLRQDQPFIYPSNDPERFENPQTDTIKLLPQEHGPASSNLSESTRSRYLVLQLDRVSFDAEATATLNGSENAANSNPFTRSYASFDQCLGSRDSQRANEKPSSHSHRFWQRRSLGSSDGPLFNAWFFFGIHITRNASQC